jgi:hypothetical protein
MVACMHLPAIISAASMVPAEAANAAHRAIYSFRCKSREPLHALLQYTQLHVACLAVWMNQRAMAAAAHALRQQPAASRASPAPPTCRGFDSAMPISVMP